MIYFISNLTGKLYNSDTIEIIRNDNLIEFQQYLFDVVNGAEVIYVESFDFEIEELNKPEVPQELHRMKIFLELADRNISIDNLKAIVNGAPSEMLTDIQKAKIIVKIHTAQTFKIDDENLVLLAPIVGITDLPEFFISANQQL